MKEKSGGTGGIEFLGLLTIVFIVLRLVGVIEWSWLWVLAPIWIPLAIVFVLLLIYIIIAGNELKKKRSRRGRWMK